MLSKPYSTTFVAAKGNNTKTKKIVSLSKKPPRYELVYDGSHREAKVRRLHILYFNTHFYECRYFFNTLARIVTLMGHHLGS